MASSLRWVSPLSRLITLLGIVTTGCLTEKDPGYGGVDDFPNSIYARVQGELDDADDVSKTEIPTEALNVIKGPPTAPQVGGIPKQGAMEMGVLNSLQGLARKSANPLASALDTQSLAMEQADSLFEPDTSWGVFAISSRSGNTTLLDSLFFAAGTNLLDSNSRNQGLAAAKRIVIEEDGSLTLTLFRDADGDGKIASPIDSAKVYVFVSRTHGDTSETAVLQVGSGPDHNFDTESDNLIYQAKWLRMLGSDTASFAEYSDADTDGILVDNGKPTLVDLTLYEYNPQDKPEVGTRRLNIRILARYQQEPQEIRRFHAIETEKDGTQNQIQIKDENGEDDLLPGSKMKVVMSVSQTPSTDTVVSTEIISTIKPESVFGKDRDSLFSYSIQTEKRLGEEKNASFSFEAETPVPPKQKPQNGKVALDLVYTDSTFVHAEGVFNQSGFIADIKGRDGKQFHGEWDANGNLKRLSITEP